MGGGALHTFPDLTFSDFIYAPIHPEMHAIFLALGPDITPGSMLPPFEVIHVYELLTHLLHLSPASNDGSLQTFEGMLRD